ncbi:hypothetical protein [Methylobacterium sp. E-065]|nr:hypothetical protein [Methylobacterium sp. E-065]
MVIRTQAEHVHDAIPSPGIGDRQAMFKSDDHLGGDLREGCQTLD